MKIGIITDIHSNNTALLAMLIKLKSEQCDKIICCGDIIGIGPEPEQTVKTVMQIENLIAVKGNHDKYFVEGMPSTVPNDENISLSEIEHHKWEHTLLSKESFNYINNLPYIVNFVVDHFTITVAHYAINSEKKYINYVDSPTLADCYNVFSSFNSDIIIYGHNHKPSYFHDSKRCFINCGSLGCPSKDIDIARGGILEIPNGKASFTVVNLQYNVDNVIEKIDDFNYPDADLIKKIFYGR